MTSEQEKVYYDALLNIARHNPSATIIEKYDIRESEHNNIVMTIMYNQTTQTTTVIKNGKSMQLPGNLLTPFVKARINAQNELLNATRNIERLVSTGQLNNKDLLEMMKQINSIKTL